LCDIIGYYYDFASVYDIMNKKTGWHFTKLPCNQLSSDLWWAYKSIVPTLIITGNHDNNVPRANSLIIAGKIPGAWLVRIKATRETPNRSEKASLKVVSNAPADTITGPIPLPRANKVAASGEEDCDISRPKYSPQPKGIGV
jgi:hypothetical protein